MRNSAIIVLSTFLAGSNVFAQSSVEQFSKLSKDGLTEIHGEIDFPEGKSTSEKFPVLFMFGGTGLFDRDYNFGNSNTDKDLLFKVLSSYYTKTGIAVVRYDYRGITCNQRTAPKCESCQTQSEIYKAYYKSCVDPKIRESVTPQNMREDILTVYETALESRRIDQENIVILAHSEGTVHVANLIGKKLLMPKALLMLGMVADSPMDMIHWQSVDRNVQWAMKYANHEGVIDGDGRSAYCHNVMKVSDQDCAQLLPKNTVLNEVNLTKIFESNYQASVTQLLAKPDTDPFPNATMPMASNAWWKMFFTDSEKPIEQLLKFQGRISFNNGDIDTQTPGIKELGLVKKYISSFSVRPHINLYQSVGHGFGSDGTMGPMKPESIQRITDETLWLLGPSAKMSPASSR